MANYGPPGSGGPSPWHEPGHDEAYGGQRHGGQPYGGDGQPYGGGQGHGGRSYDDGQSHGGGRSYDGGPSYGGGQSHHGGQSYGGGYGPGASGSPYRGSGHDAGHGDDSQDTATYPPYQDGAAETAYAGQPVSPSERGRGRGRIFAVLATVLVLVLGGATAFYLLGTDDETPTPVAAPTPEEAPVTPAEPDDEDETPAGTPSEGSSTDPRFVEPGQCVRNEGPAGGKPKLVISECAPKSYEVLRRFDGETSGERDAEAKCAPVDGYTNWYFYDSELDSLDFVLCLKQRD